MNSLVSIIVPCYNQAHFLDETLQSVIDQIYSHWECIIVNDGSPDDTEGKALEWCARDERFSYLKKENGGLPSARNAGIVISKADYIVCLDSDDILHSDYLQQLLPVLVLNPLIGIVSCYRYFFIKNKSSIIKKYTASGSNYKDLMFENKLMPSSIYRKKCWIEAGGYDETMKKGFEDWEFWLNVTKRGWTFQFVEEFLFYYRKSKKSMLVDTINNHAEANMEFIFRKHKELYIEHFDNTAEVLFYYIKTHRMGKMQLKKSIEYQVGKVITKPYRMLQNWLKKKG